jgi:hypothetical protein
LFHFCFVFFLYSAKDNVDALKILSIGVTAILLTLINPNAVLALVMVNKV